jgi:hypothetical protein
MFFRVNLLSRSIVTLLVWAGLISKSVDVVLSYQLVLDALFLEEFALCALIRNVLVSIDLVG